MRWVIVFAFSALAQSFETVSVKPSASIEGPDYNNRISYSPVGFSARAATLRRLIAEAYRVQINQVIGPPWLDRNEYEIEARAAGPSRKADLARMLRPLLAERFELRHHIETRTMPVYALVSQSGGLKIRQQQGDGIHFRGELREFADLIAVQLSIPIAADPTQPSRAGGPLIPVLDKTALEGVFEFSIDVRIEAGGNPFSLWQRALREQLGLDLQARRGDVEVIVVDAARQSPTPN